MKIICLFVISAVLFSACNRNKDSAMSAERHQANDNIQSNEEDINKNIIHENTETADNHINFADHINLTNCIITTDYHVPKIINIIIGIGDDDPSMSYIEHNSLHFRWNGFQINFKNKFWLYDGNSWQFIVKSDNSIFIDQELELNLITTIIFDDLDETPFIVNNLKNVDLNKEYTFRCIKKGTEIIIIYYSPDYSIYEPVLYIIPNEQELEEYIDIGISWNNEKVKGVYFFRNFRIDELPNKEERAAVMDFVMVN